MRRLSKSGPLRAKSDSPQDFRSDLEALVPFLRGFSRSLCGNRDLADDLAQEALTKAWTCRESYALGTNLKAWLFTILRNEFYSNRRRAWRQVSWDQDAAEQRYEDGSQLVTLELSDTMRALHRLQPEQREALILISAGGFSCEEVAKICQCAEGTVKSRVSRGRRNLQAILDGNVPLLAVPHPHEGDAAQELMSQLAILTSSNLCYRAGPTCQLAMLSGAG